MHISRYFAISFLLTGFLIAELWSGIFLNADNTLFLDGADLKGISANGTEIISEECPSPGICTQEICRIYTLPNVSVVGIQSLSPCSLNEGKSTITLLGLSSLATLFWLLAQIGCFCWASKQGRSQYQLISPAPRVFQYLGFSLLVMLKVFVMIPFVLLLSEQHGNSFWKGLAMLFLYAVEVIFCLREFRNMYSKIPSSNITELK